MRLIILAHELANQKRFARLLSAGHQEGLPALALLSFVHLLKSFALECHCPSFSPMDYNLQSVLGPV